MLTVATYNILHGYHKDLICANLKTLVAKGADVICLQEADTSFEPVLIGLLRAPELKGWKTHLVHFGIGGNLAFLWNSSCATFHNVKTVLLPTIAPVLLQRMKWRNTLLQRVAVVGKFLVGGRNVRITNVHLAWEGGVRHRLAQLGRLWEALACETPDVDIIAGDFNTFAPARSRLYPQREVWFLEGSGYRDVLPELSWSCDISHTAPQDKWETVAKVCKLLHIKLRSRLDYILAKNAKVLSAEMLDLPGSDHRPLVAKFQITELGV